MKESFVVNSQPSLDAFLDKVVEWYEGHKYLTFDEPRFGRERSLSQNALIHVWLTEAAAFYLKKDPKEVTEGELEGMKRKAKSECWRMNRWPWLVVTIIDPKTGDKKVELRSSAKYSTSEAFEFLFWFQALVSFDGLKLEARGQYEKLLKQQEGAG